MRISDWSSDVCSSDLGAALRWSGKSFDNASNSLVLDDYTLIDLRTELRVSENVRFFARAENIFDEHYRTAYRYGELGRSIYAGLPGRFRCAAIFSPRRRIGRRLLTRLRGKC